MTNLHAALAETGVNFPVELVIAIAAVLVLGGAAAAIFAGRRRRAGSADRPADGDEGTPPSTPPTTPGAPPSV